MPPVRGFYFLHKRRKGFVPQSQFELANQVTVVGLRKPKMRSDTGKSHSMFSQYGSIRKGPRIINGSVGTVRMQNLYCYMSYIKPGSFSHFCPGLVLLVFFSGLVWRLVSCFASFDAQPVNCQGNGRPDREYENWRWKPSKCDLPRFDGKKFQELMRGKTIAFIGDSVAQNQMESLLCILWQASCKSF
ncbi:uncharacterized protein LOC131310082 [Rhododendron vialii]|uniref:uncharacterized protein LOC131310082 n=1 Tax=Rhododendron vialii TaxID=182163 RepID=UPI00265EDCA0|nr:uncharacterized protein LOC131310082 [Rhododendron vialii]